MQRDTRKCKGVQRDARVSKGVQHGAREGKGCSEAKPAAANSATAKADYSRPRQTMADQSIAISAVLPASQKHFYRTQVSLGSDLWVLMSGSH